MAVPVVVGMPMPVGVIVPRAVSMPATVPVVMVVVRSTPMALVIAARMTVFVVDRVAVATGLGLGADGIGVVRRAGHPAMIAAFPGRSAVVPAVAGSSTCARRVTPSSIAAGSTVTKDRRSRFVGARAASA